MGNKKLVWSCIIGIVLGFIAPRFWKIDQQTSLMIGMAGGLGIGYLLDILDEKKAKDHQQTNNSRKAREANELMEQARAELQGKSQSMNPETDIDEDEADASEDSVDLEEKAARLNEAEEMLRKARERMNKQR